jgi:xanthine dehydrogenase accessory factor
MANDKPFDGLLAVVKGAGELASGVAFRLRQAGFRVVMTDLEEPTCTRYPASFASAMALGRTVLEGVRGERAADADRALAIASGESVAVIADPQAAVVRHLRPVVLVDAIMAKRNTGTRLDDAPIVVGLGPGFVAGRDVHAVVETKRGHRLGWLITDGAAEPSTGVPDLIEGQGLARVLRAPHAGRVSTQRRIGERVHAGDVVLTIAATPVISTISGILRGLLPDGYEVESGAKLGDVDPSAEPEYCYTLSDRALAVGSGALAAVLELWPRLPAADVSPRWRGRRGPAVPGVDVLSPVEYVLLGLLLDQPAHGYELSKAFAPGTELAQVCDLGLSQLYSSLAKLESLGLVESRRTPGRGQQGRKVFDLTSAGRGRFARWLTDPVPDVHHLRTDFAPKLLLARRLDPAAAEQLVEDQLRMLGGRLEAAPRLGGPGFAAEVARADALLTRAAIDWLRTLLARSRAIMAG